MGRIKLNLVSGAVVEKPLINAFVANNNSYIVLDNEMNGSMGLPIILVSKLENNRLTKIIDQNEWQVVKEYLKNIIAGGQIQFIGLSSELAADDIYYTQLTLPIPSFDALKNAYKVDQSGTDNNVGVLDINLSPNPVEQPVVSSTPINPVGPAPVQNTAINDNIVEPSGDNKPLIDITNEVVTPNVSPTPEAVVAPTVNVAPNVDINSQMPVFNAGETVNNSVQNNFEPEISPTPIIDTSIPNNQPMNNDVFKEQKAAFMQACENMFDALVQKFEKELDNRK